MSTLVIDNAKRITKYIGLFLLSLIGLYVGTIIVQFIYNLGIYLGTFIRCIYAFACY